MEIKCQEFAKRKETRQLHRKNRSSEKSRIKGQNQRSSNFNTCLYINFNTYLQQIREKNRASIMLGKNLFSGINMPSAKTVVSTAASIAASAMVVRSIAHEFVPYELRQYISLNIQSLFQSFSPEMVLIIEEFDGIASNEIYKAAEIYLGAKISPSTQRFKVTLREKETKISTSMAKNQEIMDIFTGVRFKWRQITRQVESKTVMYPGLYSSSVSQSEVRCFELSFHKKHKDMVFSAYFPFIMEESKNVKEEKKTLKIYTLNSEHTRRYSGAGYPWSSVNLDHPAAFDTLAMDADLKRKIMDDLQGFVKRRGYYKRVGRAYVKIFSYSHS